MNMPKVRKDIKIKKEDLEKIKVKTMKRSAWELKAKGSVGEKVHQDPRFKKSKYKEKLEDLETYE